MPPSITNGTRQLIVFLHQQGLSIRAIARALNVGRNTVSLWVTRYAEEGNIVDRRQSNHGIPILTPEQRNEMWQSYEENGFIPTNYFAQRFDCHPKTIRKHLNSMNLHNRRPCYEIALTEAQKTARLNFAQQFLDFDWSSTIFCDGKSFTSSDHGRLHLWRYDQTRYTTDNHVIPNMESRRISAKGIAGIIRQNGSGRCRDFLYKCGWSESPSPACDCGAAGQESGTLETAVTKYYNGNPAYLFDPGKDS